MKCSHILSLIMFLSLIIISCSKSTTEIHVQKTNTPTIISSVTENGSSIVMSCSTSDAEIYFSLDGTEPTQNSYKYTQPFHLGHSSVIKARAFFPGYEQSDIVEKSISVSNESLLENLYDKEDTDIYIQISSMERIIYANSNLGTDNITQFNWSLSINGNNVDNYMENGGYEEAGNACWTLPVNSNVFAEGSIINLELSYTYTKNGIDVTKNINGSVTNAYQLRNLSRIDELNTIQFNWESNGNNDIIYLTNINNGNIVYSDFIPSELNQIVIMDPALGGYYRLNTLNYKRYGRNVVISFCNNQDFDIIRRRK